MKKNFILISILLLALSLSAYGLLRKEKPVTAQAYTSNVDDEIIDLQVQSGPQYKANPNFFFGIGSRFNTMKKEELLKATSFADFIGEKHAKRIVSYKSLSVSVLVDGEQTDEKEMGYSGTFTPAQLAILNAADYSTNLLIWAEYTETSEATGELEESHWTPYVTVVPEVQASYQGGEGAILEYLERFSEEVTAGLTEDKVQSGKLEFTVTKNGIISGIKVTATSGFKEVDEKIKELISKLPGTWEPAKNFRGDKVDQTLVISFGRMGC